jgi:hypothetical protein
VVHDTAIAISSRYFFGIAAVLALDDVVEPEPRLVVGGASVRMSRSSFVSLGS